MCGGRPRAGRLHTTTSRLGGRRTRLRTTRVRRGCRGTRAAVVGAPPQALPAGQHRRGRSSPRWTPGASHLAARTPRGTARGATRGRTRRSRPCWRRMFSTVPQASRGRTSRDWRMPNACWRRQWSGRCGRPRCLWASAALPRGCCCLGRRVPARRCWPRRQRVRPTCRSYPSAARTSWRCLWVSAQRACATCLLRRARSRPP
mmetsp:Transcript_10812/g.27810  ORF Transcript_10812/g.27810 Transcript_10812/m.27810 type:complete len:203 (-) Transcript_10812:1296-1904(-)